MKSRYGLEIRAATSAEAPGLAELLASVGHMVAADTLAARLDAVRREAGTALIAMEWGPPSGLVVAHWYRTLGVDQPTAQITTLLVGPDERRRGIGRMLLKAVAQAARVAGCGGLEIVVRPDQGGLSAGLEAFCRATGFTGSGACFERALRKKG